MTTRWFNSSSAGLVILGFLLICISTCLAQENGDIRLVDGEEHTEGRVEVYQSGVWGTVCDDGWTIQEAEVVCYQLGFGPAAASLTNAHFGKGTGPVLMDDVQCSGQEERLADCVFRDVGHNCGHEEDASVICTNVTLFSSTAPTSALRLAGGKSSAGRVEIYVNGQWGTVCDDGWDISQATVVCRHLGFQRATAALAYAAFGEGTGPIQSDHTNCIGNETDFLQCQFQSEGFCGHFEDASVVCYNPEKGSEERSIRLAGGNETAGRVEIYLNGEWGTVCDDAWEINDANVVCNQLGFAGALDYRDSAAFGEGTGEIHLDDVGCNGEETELLSCNYNSIDNCNHAEDASVICQLTPKEPTPEEGSIRLAGGNETAGRVEIFLNRKWGTVCDDGWDIHDADVVCNQLGFFWALDYLGSAAFGEGTGEIHLDDVRCGGEETELLRCYHNNIDDCNHGEDAGVSCQFTSNEPMPEEGSIRLAGGNETAGRVEIFLNREWGTVCDDEWDIHDANVVCYQLGYVWALDYRGSAAFGEGTGEIHLDDVRCDGEETKLLRCYYKNYDNCNHGEDAGVICQLTSDEHTPEEGSIRLAGGIETAGRVEIFLNREWGTVCDDAWDINDAKVVCNQLGFALALESRGSAAFGEGTGKIHLDDVGCGGEETELLSCYYNSFDNCNHGEDASVICQLTSDEPTPGFSLLLIHGGSSGQNDIHPFKEVMTRSYVDH